MAGGPANRLNERPICVVFPIPNLTLLAKRHRETSYIRPHFDKAFYLRRYADVASSSMDPVSHYVRFGAAEGRDPAPGFSTTFYLRQNGDVAQTGMNAFYHYLRFGKAEGRAVLPADGGALSMADGTDGDFYDEPEAEPPPPCVFDARWFAQLDRDFLRDRRGVHTDRLDMRPHPREDMDLALLPAPADPSEVPGVDRLFVDQLLAQLPGKTLSLDIWDTILRRSCHPDEVKLRAARALWLRGWGDNPALADLHPLDLMRLRAVAEAAAADDAWEYRFTEVAPIWLRMAGLPEAQADQVLATEMAIEKACAYADPTITTLMREHAGRTIAVSDFYLSAASLSDLLRDKDAAPSGTVYASCDAMATKRKGDLFGHVLQREGLSPDQVLHIGDRRDADVERPRSLGLHSALYESPGDLARIEVLAGRFEAHQRGDLAPHSAALLAAAGGAQEDGALPVEAMAVVVTGFVLHVLEEAVRRRVDCVHFFTREGVFFKRIYGDLVATDVLDMGQYPESALLEVSRRATFAASLNAFTIPEMMRLWSLYSTQSMRALAVTLNIAPEDWQPAAASIWTRRSAIRGKTRGCRRSLPMTKCARSRRTASASSAGHCWPIWMRQGSRRVRQSPGWSSISAGVGRFRTMWPPSVRAAYMGVTWGWTGS